MPDMQTRRWARRLECAASDLPSALAAQPDDAARALVDEALVSDDVGSAADADQFVAAQLEQSAGLIDAESRERIAHIAAIQIRERLALPPPPAHGAAAHG